MVWEIWKFCRAADESGAEIIKHWHYIDQSVLEFLKARHKGANLGLEHPATNTAVGIILAPNLAFEPMVAQRPRGGFRRC
uniref:Uncharacterized protein n=1 Tax=Globodera rostochiensis TaxID=31243 RepID=A0A914GZT3_GLORO